MESGWTFKLCGGPSSFRVNVTRRDNVAVLLYPLSEMSLLGRFCVGDDENTKKRRVWEQAVRQPWLKLLTARNERRKKKTTASTNVRQPRESETRESLPIAE